MKRWLPSDRPFLMVAVRIINPNEHTVPMYWWSNIAVDETPETRVLVPADTAFDHGMDQRLKIAP